MNPCGASPIIFVTAISKEERYASQAAEIGAVDYIFKPINPEISRSKVKVYLDIDCQREQILKLNAVLSQSNEELERFAYICSHDMQEPVRMMNTYAGLLEEKSAGRLDQQAGSYLRFIIGNAQRMQKMIQDILTFSRVGRENEDSKASIATRCCRRRSLNSRRSSPKSTPASSRATCRCWKPIPP